MAPCNAKESLTIPQSNSVLVSSFSMRMFNVPPKVIGILRTVKDSRIYEICREAFYFNTINCQSKSSVFVENSLQKSCFDHP